MRIKELAQPINIPAQECIHILNSPTIDCESATEKQMPGCSACWQRMNATTCIARSSPIVPGFEMWLAVLAALFFFLKAVDGTSSCKKLDKTGEQDTNWIPGSEHQIAKWRDCSALTMEIIAKWPSQTMCRALGRECLQSARLAGMPAPCFNSLEDLSSIGEKAAIELLNGSVGRLYHVDRISLLLEQVKDTRLLSTEVAQSVWEEPDLAFHALRTLPPHRIAPLLKSPGWHALPAWMVPMVEGDLISLLPDDIFEQANADQLSALRSDAARMLRPAQLAHACDTALSGLSASQIAVMSDGCIASLHARHLRRMCNNSNLHHLARTSADSAIQTVRFNAAVRRHPCTALRARRYALGRAARIIVDGGCPPVWRMSDRFAGVNSTCGGMQGQEWRHHMLPLLGAVVMAAVTAALFIQAMVLSVQHRQ